MQWQILQLQLCYYEGPEQKHYTGSQDALLPKHTSHVHINSDPESWFSTSYKNYIYIYTYIIYNYSESNLYAELHTCNDKAFFRAVQDFPVQINHSGVWYRKPLDHKAGLWLVHCRCPLNLQLEVIQSIDTDACRGLELCFEDILFIMLFKN